MELTREVSVKFSEWLIRKCDFQEDKTWLYKGMDFSIKDLFEIFEHDVE